MLSPPSGTEEVLLSSPASVNKSKPFLTAHAPALLLCVCVCVCVWRGSGHEDLSGIAVGLIRNKGFGLGKGMIAISDGWMDGWMDRWGGIGWGEVRIALRVMQHTSLPTMIKHFASFLLFISILMRLGLFNCHSSCALNQHIRMISEGSFDTEDWSNSCWKFRFASQE